MDTKTFFEKFELFADAPNAVEKMRELILQLAIAGKLVPQDPKEEPASRLIERAVAIASRGPDAIEQKRAIETWESSEQEMPRKLPIGWSWTCNAIIGDTSPRVNAKDDALVAFAPMNIIPTDYRESLKPEIRPWGEIKKGYTHFADGDIAVAKITPCFQNGKACVMTALPGGMGAGTTELHVLRPFPNMVDPLFMLLYFKSPEFVQGGVETFTGTAGQQRVSNDYFRFRPISLPPLAEQKRIVAKVDELMELCDRLEAQQAEREQKHAALARASLSRFAEASTPANLELLFHNAHSIDPADLRKSILTLAVQGKLVSHDANDEPVSALIKRLVLLTSAAGKVPKSLRPIDTDALPFELPFAWEWIQAQDLCRPSSLITYGVLKPVWVDVGVPTVRVQDIQDGVILVEGVGQCSPERAAKFGKTTLEAGDLLIAKDGATLGKTALVPPSLAGGNITQHVLRFPMTPHVDRLFIRLVIDSPHGQAWMRSETKGVALPGVNVGDFRRMPIPLAPVAEQRRIVAKVDQLMALVDQLEAQLAASRATAEKLMEAVVAELTQAGHQHAQDARALEGCAVVMGSV